MHNSWYTATQHLHTNIMSLYKVMGDRDIDNEI